VETLDIDIVRFVTILILTLVAVAYLKSAIELGILLLRNRPNVRKFVYHLNLGRILGSLGVVILALTVIEGHVIRWHEPLSVRIPLSILAALLLLWGWYNSSRFVFRADVPSITRADIREDAERNK